MDKASNSYEGVESVANFRDAASIEQYRQAALDKSREQAGYIARRFPQARHMLEAGCGNGRLLVTLADRLEHGYGFDLAESRIAFANKWLDDRGIRNLSIWHDDALAPSRRVMEQEVDLALCVTGAFGYFEAMKHGAEHQVIRLLADVVRPGGGLILELFQHPKEVAACLATSDHRLNSWRELPESDPFRFYLSEYAYDPARRTLCHHKTFIGRDGQIDDGRTEMLKIYTPDEITAVLAPWFENVTLHGDWRDTPYTDGNDLLVVTAVRRS